jgi:hypothetical protein
MQQPVIYVILYLHIKSQPLSTYIRYLFKKNIKLCILSFGWFAGVWILCVDVSEHCLFHIHWLFTPPMKMEQTECSETSAHKIHTPGKHPKERIQHSQLGECLKSGISNLFRVITLSGYRLTRARLFPDRRCKETEGTKQLRYTGCGVLCGMLVRRTWAPRAKRYAKSENMCRHSTLECFFQQLWNQKFLVISTKPQIDNSYSSFQEKSARRFSRWH